MSGNQAAKQLTAAIAAQRAKPDSKGCSVQRVAEIKEKGESRELSSKPARVSPWRGSLVAGVGACAVGLLLMAFWMHVSWPGAIWAAIICYVVGAVFVFDASKRRYGEYVERRSIKRFLKQAPTGWICETNVRLDGLGDVDLLVDIDSIRFVVEIKSQGSVRYVNPVAGREKILRRSGRKLQKDPISQVMSVAKRTGAVPVLWFPNAQPLSTRMRCAVWLHMGNEKTLIKMLQKAVKKNR